MTDLRNAIARALKLDDGTPCISRDKRRNALCNNVDGCICLSLADAVLSTLSARRLVIVPREATEEMEKSGAMQFAMRMQRITTAGDNAVLVYIAMLAASPYFPKGE